MSNAHTPGPWIFKADHPQNACAHVRTYAQGFRFNLATLYNAPGDNPEMGPDGVWGDHPIRDANARLIAAAPDMLEALRECRDCIKRYHFDDRPDLVAKADAAITKAKGRNND